jgi:hypothetical protein
MESSALAVLSSYRVGNRSSRPASFPALSSLQDGVDRYEQLLIFDRLLKKGDRTGFECSFLESVGIACG